MQSPQLPRTLTNYNLLKLFFATLLEKNLKDQEIDLIASKLLDQIQKLVWVVILSNSTSEQLKKLKSKKESEVTKAIGQMIKTSKNNPQVVLEIKKLLQQVLIGLNQEITD